MNGERGALSVRQLASVNSARIVRDTNIFARWPTNRTTTNGYETRSRVSMFLFVLFNHVRVNVHHFDCVTLTALALAALTITILGKLTTHSTEGECLLRHMFAIVRVLSHSYKFNILLVHHQLEPHPFLEYCSAYANTWIDVLDERAQKRQMVHSRQESVLVCDEDGLVCANSHTAPTFAYLLSSLLLAALDWSARNDKHSARPTCTSSLWPARCN